MNTEKLKAISVATVWAAMFMGCNGIGGYDDRSFEQAIDTVYIHDTIKTMPEGEFVYNLPCKVVNIHQEQEGKSLLFVWLHGGVRDRQRHDLLDSTPIDCSSHLDCCAADDSVLNYQHSAAKWHGRDDIEVTLAFLDRFFSHSKE